MDILRTKLQSHFTSHFCIIGSVHHVCAKLRLDQDLIMHTLERNVPYRSSNLCLIRFHNIQILRAENNLNGFVVLKSLVYTFKTEASNSTRKSLIIVPSIILDSPIKPATKRFSGSL